jgi:flagellar motor switch protein FliM
MSRLLTQQEVDALLAEFGGDAASAAVPTETPFDLRAPIVLAGERLALVQAACEKIVVRCAESLSLQIVSDKPVKGEFIGLVQQPATTVLGTLPPGEPLGVIVDEHNEAVGGISLQAELAIALVDRLQGGEGLASEGARLMSTVELRLLEAALARLVRYLEKHTALRSIASGGIDPDPAYGRLAARGGVLATAMMRFTTTGGTAACRLLLTPVLVNLLVAQAEARDQGPIPPELMTALGRVPIGVEPVVIGGSVRLFDLLRLGPGRTIQLELRAKDPIGLRLNGALLARGRLTRQAEDRFFSVEELT